MPLELTDNARALLENENVRQQIVLEIEGIDFVFSTEPTNIKLEYGLPNVLYGQGLVYGQTIPDPKSKDLISLEKTTYSLRQQLRTDRTESNSVQKLTINMVDEAEFLTKLLAPGFTIPDILGAEARVYIGFTEGIHPQDSVVILNGVIDDISFGAGNCLISVSNPLDLARAQIFEQVSEETTAAITDADTTIPLEAVGALLESQDAVTTYVRIDDEIIEVGNINGLNLENCVRGQLGTTASAHDDGASVDSIYRFQGRPTELALKLLLSNPGEPTYFTGSVTSFVKTGTIDQDGALFLPLRNGSNVVGAVSGDFVTITGASNPANNVTDVQIISAEEEFNGYVITVNAPISLETDASATITIRSQYNVLADGCGLKPKQVDIEQFDIIALEGSSDFFDYDLPREETIDSAKSFIDTELYKPSGLFSLPRKGRVSVSRTRPPLGERNTRVLNRTNLKNPSKLAVKRSTNKNFYNAVVYRFEKGIIEEKFLRGVVTQSAASTNRIKTRNKPLNIDSDGIKDTPENLIKIERQTRRYLDRFQFAALSITVEPQYKIGFPIEIGDTCILDGDGLFISDPSNGTREFSPRVFEVVNKTMNIKTGAVSLELLDTNFGVSGRFGSISQASYLKDTSTQSILRLKKSFGTTELEEEVEKYEDYIGLKFKVRSPDFTFCEEVTVTSIVESELDALTVDPPLSQVPQDGWLIEAPNYGDDTNPQIKSFFKSIHAFLDPIVSVVSGSSNTQFEVAASDIDKFTVGNLVLVRNADFSDTSDLGILGEDLIVTDIDTVGNIITTNRDIGFTPNNTHFVELIGFLDGGEPYIFV